MGHDIWYYLGNDLRMIVHHMVHIDTYRIVQRQFEQLFVPLWRDGPSCYSSIQYSEIASWRDLTDITNQTCDIYCDIRRVARDRFSCGRVTGVLCANYYHAKLYK